MWPRTAKGEEKQRAHKRSMEGGVLLEMLREEIRRRGNSSATKILEFGAGAGYQASWLGHVGPLVVSDIYIDPELRLPDGVPFVLCDVAEAPFPSARFDVIFSNHVIEHLADYEASFRELQRIGTADCIYAFAVPTALWVLLSVPVQYRDKAGNVVAKVVRKNGHSTNGNGNGAANGDDFSERVDHADYGGGSFIEKMLPHGHGRFGKFHEAFHQFRAGSWRALFAQYDFELVRDRPVLCYGPAGWPIIPPNRTMARFGICSSRVFFLRKKP